MELWERAQQRSAEFNATADAYDTFRPRYPPEVFDAIVDHLGDQERPPRAVDVGAGTAIATAPLISRGFTVVAVEPAPAMAALAKAKMGSSGEVFVGRFEDWPPQGPVDLVCAFNSWHWVKPSVAVPKAADILRPGGALALVWTKVVRYGQPPFDQRLTELGAPTFGAYEVATASLDHVAQEPRFGIPTIVRCELERSLDADTFLSERHTYGTEHSIEIDERIRTLINEEFSGTVTKIEQAVAYLYRRDSALIRCWRGLPSFRATPATRAAARLGSEVSQPPPTRVGRVRRS